MLQIMVIGIGVRIVLHVFYEYLMMGATFINDNDCNKSMIVINQSIDRPIDRLINQTINQSIN